MSDIFTGTPPGLTYDHEIAAPQTTTWRRRQSRRSSGHNRVLGRRALGRRQAVGEEALRVVVGDPDGRAVGPDAVGVVVGGGEGVFGEQLPALQVVAEEAGNATLIWPHRDDRFGPTPWS